MLPATFVRGITGSGGETAMRITAWGWEAAWYSILPFFFLPWQADDPRIWLWALASGASNIGFIAAAILVAWRKRRAALACIVAALSSMLYAGFAIPERQSDLIGGPAGHLGPGYYAWVIAGALLLWTAYSSRSAR